jgi:hypothetical protein
LKLKIKNSKCGQLLNPEGAICSGHLEIYPWSQGKPPIENELELELEVLLVNGVVRAYSSITKP